MAYFSNDFLQFFKQLSDNNNKDWFDKHRKVYEKSAKVPFYQFIDDLIGRINTDDSSINLQAKDAVFRINRDIRFSPDKTPYKIHMAGLISAGGRKDKTTPGIYIQLSAEDARIYAGAHMLDKNQLLNVRRHIASNLDEFKKLTSDKDFVAKFGEIRGEKNKVLPAEFKPVLEKEPLIANKSFYYFARFKPDAVTQDNFSDLVMEHYHTAKPMNTFLKEGLAG